MLDLSGGYPVIRYIPPDEASSARVLLLRDGRQDDCRNIADMSLWVVYEFQEPQPFRWDTLKPLTAINKDLYAEHLTVVLCYS